MPCVSCQMYSTHQKHWFQQQMSDAQRQVCFGLAQNSHSRWVRIFSSWFLFLQFVCILRTLLFLSCVRIWSKDEPIRKETGLTLPFPFPGAHSLYLASLLIWKKVAGVSARVDHFWLRHKHDRCIHDHGEGLDAPLNPFLGPFAARYLILKTVGGRFKPGAHLAACVQRIPRCWNRANASNVQCAHLCFTLAKMQTQINQNLAKFSRELCISCFALWAIYDAKYAHTAKERIELDVIRPPKALSASGTVSSSDDTFIWEPFLGRYKETRWDGCKGRCLLRLPEVTVSSSEIA